MHDTKIITIDTDNAVIRLYSTEARRQGVSEVTIRQLRHDLAAVAMGVSSVTGASFRVEVL